jgi:hypothetical protein
MSQSVSVSVSKSGKVVKPNAKGGNAKGKFTNYSPIKENIDE